MKSTGIVRKIDELGRIVIPREMRRTMGIETGDGMEMLIDEDLVILRKYKPTMRCDVTGKVDNSNKQILNGKLTVSEEGARLLMQELTKL